MKTAPRRRSTIAQIIECLEERLLFSTTAGTRTVAGQRGPTAVRAPIPAAKANPASDLLETVNNIRGANIVPTNIHTSGIYKNSLNNIVSELKNQNVNTVRYQLIPPPHTVAPSEGLSRQEDIHNYVDEYLKDTMFPKLKDFLAEVKIQNANIKVILDLHNPPMDVWGDEVHDLFAVPVKVGNSEVSSAEAARVQTLREDALEAIAYFWDQVSEEIASPDFNDKDLVIGYDPLNEAKTVDGSLWNEVATALILKIRHNSPTATIFLEPRQGSVHHVASLRKIFDRFDNLVLSVNVYPPRSYTHQLVPGPQKGDVVEFPDKQRYSKEVIEAFQAEIKKLVKFANTKMLAGKQIIPVMIGEFSVSIYAPGAAKYLKNAIGLFRQIGAGFNILSFRPIDPSDPNNAGRIDPFDLETNKPRAYQVILNAFKR